MPRSRKVPDGTHTEVYSDPPKDNRVQHRYTEFSSGSRCRTSSVAVLSKPRPEKPLRVVTEPRAVSKPLPDQDLTFLDDAHSIFTYTFADPNAAEQVGEEVSQFNQSNQPPATVLREWEREIPRFLHETLRHEGLENFINVGGCICGKSKWDDNLLQIYRCVDCYECTVWCKTCLLSRHESNPFHRVEHWNGKFFEKTSLYELGLVLHLGHSPLQPCLGDCNIQKFTIIDVDCIHNASVRFCNCERTQPLRYQLLRARLYPATLAAPQTAATFSFLKFFQLLSFMSKVSATEYYSTLERMTDNTGTNVPKSRSREVLRMIREWRHLRSLKRSGVGYDGVDSNAAGVLAVKCPACPHVGINIPARWFEDRSKIWLYKAFFALDANFRLTRFNVSSEERDPGLNRGRAYFVDDPALQRHIAAHHGRWPVEKSDCSDHDAIKLANRRGDHNLASTGLALAVCARHDTIHAHSGVDLRLGEEYLLMDYALLSSLRGFPNLPITISYDIMCQYSKKLYQRIHSYPAILHTPTPFPRYQLLVPKFHLAAHKQDCVWSFSYNYAMGVGRTEGEGVERNWAIQNSLSGSTKKMGPGSRRDTLDDHFGDHNWRKTISLAHHIYVKAIEAANIRAKMVVAYSDASQALDETTIASWRKMVTEWELDPDKRKSNPYEPKVRGFTLHKLRHDLAQEDAELIKTDLAAQAVSSRMSRHQLIYQGIELEEQLRRLRYDMTHTGNNPTYLARAKLTERANSLRRRVNAFAEVQTLHMPVTAILRQQASSSSESEAVYDLPLLLPSQVFQMGSSCEMVLLDFEWRIRYAAAHDALEQMRKHLLGRNAVLEWKNRYGHGVREGNRSHADVERLDTKISACASRYRTHYTILKRFAQKLGKVTWETDLRPLLDEDIRSISRGKNNDATGEGYVISSWIWNISGVDHTDEGNITDCLRISWCKARARALRWQEECLLLQEEMRRVKAFLKYEQELWEKRARITTHPGGQAYAYRQAHLREKIREFCVEKWKDLDVMLSTGEGGFSLDNASRFAF